MVAVKKAIESGYIGVCSIIETQKVKGENHITKETDVIVHENIQCKLSFESSSSAKSDGMVNNISQSVKLFISPEIKVKPGSKIIVVQNGEKFEFKQSGEPIPHSTHQEIYLELVKRWS